MFNKNVCPYVNTTKHCTLHATPAESDIILTFNNVLTNHSISIKVYFQIQKCCLGVDMGPSHDKKYLVLAVWVYVWTWSEVVENYSEVN